MESPSANATVEPTSADVDLERFAAMQNGCEVATIVRIRKRLKLRSGTFPPNRLKNGVEAFAGLSGNQYGELTPMLAEHFTATLKGQFRD